MKKQNQKYYVVWIGRSPGVYSSWPACLRQVHGYANAKHKSFTSSQAAENAFRDGHEKHWGSNGRLTPKKPNLLSAAQGPITDSLCVDAAWNSQTKAIEYRGVWLADKSIAFQLGPYWDATNNIAEFLAIVDGLSLLASEGRSCPVYSDSKVAIGWVRDKEVRSKSVHLGKTSSQINDLVHEAVEWLNDNDQHNPVLKWVTRIWGENPADFGRK
jgi:ribonuclease HI